jgi:hypothetical protein
MSPQERTLRKPQKFSTILVDKIASRIKHNQHYDIDMVLGVDRAVIKRIGDCVILVAGPSDQVTAILRTTGV